jgi:hypothetical protein
LLLTLDRGGRDSASTGSDSWAAGPGFWLIVVAGGLGVLVMIAGAALAAVDSRADTGTPVRPGGALGWDARGWDARGQVASGQDSPDSYALRGVAGNPAWHPQNDPYPFVAVGPYPSVPADPSDYPPAGNYPPAGPARFTPPWAP